MNGLALTLAPISVTALAVLARPALRYLVLLLGMIIAVRGAHPDDRIRAYYALAQALTPATLPRGRGAATDPAQGSD